MIIVHPEECLQSAGRVGDSMTTEARSNRATGWNNAVARRGFARKYIPATQFDAGPSSAKATIESHLFPLIATGLDPSSSATMRRKPLIERSDTMSERAYSPLIAGIEEIRRIAKPSSKPKSTNSTPSCRPCRTKLQRLRVTSRLPSLLARSTYARSTKSPWQSRNICSPVN